MKLLGSVGMLGFVATLLELCIPRTPNCRELFRTYFWVCEFASKFILILVIKKGMAFLQRHFDMT